MNRVWIPASLLLLVLCTLSCGTSPGRQLQSITIAKSVSGQQIQFVATGTYSAAPTTVSPLPVDWSLGLLAPPPKEYTYTLTSQPYMYDCANTTLVNPGVVTALAPIDPNAPGSGTTKKVVAASFPFGCQ